MDALKFLIERKRMCQNHTACNACPLTIGNCGLGTNMSNEEYKRIITAVEKWTEEHPRKTRQSEFLEQWPEAEIDVDGQLTICPKRISATYRKEPCSKQLCHSCRREFWMQEVE